MANLEAKTKTKSNSKYTEDWIPIRNISNGMIVLDNKILKLIEELGVEKSITLIEILNDINQIIVKEKINER